MSLLAAVPGILQAGAGILGGKSDDEKWAEYRHKKARMLEPDLLKGLTDADLAKVSSYMRFAAMPFVNRSASTAGARFGRSGAVAGATANAVGQSYAAPLANFAMEIPQINLATKRYLHGQYSS